MMSPLRLQRVLRANHFLNIAKRGKKEQPVEINTSLSQDLFGTRQFKEIPSPPSLPLLGSAWLLAPFHDFLNITAQINRNFGDIVVLRNLMGFGDVLWLFNPEDIEAMYRTEGQYPKRHGFNSIRYYRNVVRKDIFGDVEGLLTSDDEEWADFRMKVNPILMQPRTLQQYITSINDVADDFLERTREFMAASPEREMPANYVDEIYKWALESVGVVALDTRLGCIEQRPTEEARKMASYILDCLRMSGTLDFSPLAPFMRRFNAPIWRRYIKYQDYFTNKVLSLIDEAIQKIDSDPNYAFKSESDKSAFEKLRAKGKMLAVVMILDMLTAGVDTTGKTAAAILYFLSVNGRVQAKLREEVRAALPGAETRITKEVLEQMPYLRAVIKEALRIAPITPTNLRITQKDMVLGRYNIPKGTTVFLPHLYLSLDTRYYKSPKEFRPERWIRDDPASELAKANPFICLPFGYGPRSCIGKRLANLELEILIAKMIKNFDLSWHHKPMKFGLDFLYGVKSPVKVRLAPLENNHN